MNNIYAVVENGVVINIVVWDGKSEWQPVTGEAVSCSAQVGIGWLYDGSNFTQPPTPEQTPEELAAANMAKAASEYERASVVIVALNEQIEDEDYAGTTEEAVKSELAAWTDYRKQLRAYIKAGDGSQTLPSFVMI
ncbi:hypothetical protein ACE19A_07015 [Escherichia coli]|uniref:hypothetical protein n=1 Tax=Escherichia coli TaxID=562 RepID=UPI0009440C69|nr:hypothetical protein [Escherichia coli]EHM8973251.1 hypothetical protein [Escherichia coli]MCD9327911.1 hypothetical protein [Escherichia coli]MCD9330914.1 hypothetical protein [Escherichia coli]MCX9227736.1 hypothetical protein [Escherichia coli]MCX9240646.1 hypothetical protein [Escherichia coli]